MLSTSRVYFDLLLKHHFPHDQMLFLAGPRQVGKTTLAKLFLKKFGCQNLYYNWDDSTQKRKLIADPFAFETAIPSRLKHTPVIVFDEIHKHARWKNYLKGVYDRLNERVKIVVTGSGRLNVYKKGADSLLGRFFMYQLAPFSVGELLRIESFKELRFLQLKFSEKKESPMIFKRLLKFSGFPQPYLKHDETFLKRWNDLQQDLILHQDVRDLSNVREISLIDHLMTLLPDKVGSPLSTNSLTEDVGVSFKTIKNWLSILERVYYFFEIPPYNSKLSRAIKKEKKIYFWNWTIVSNESNRYENLLAAHLKKTVNILNDFGLADAGLFYCRNKDGLETDFLLTLNKKPCHLIEAKLTDTTPDSSLRHYMRALGLKKAFQVVGNQGIDFIRRTPEGEIRVISADRFLTAFL